MIYGSLIIARLTYGRAGALRSNPNPLSPAVDRSVDVVTSYPDSPHGSRCNRTELRAPRRDIGAETLQ